jgi:hypothetical protein
MGEIATRILSRWLLWVSIFASLFSEPSWAQSQIDLPQTLREAVLKTLGEGNRNLQVEATLETESKTERIVMDVNGEDFRIDFDSGWKLIRSGGSYWLSKNNGVTWRPTGEDKLIFEILLSPIARPFVNTLGGESSVKVESLGEEDSLGEPMMHLRLNGAQPGDTNADLSDAPQYWLAKGQDAELEVRRARVLIKLGNDPKRLIVDVRYTKIGKVPPILPPKKK